MNAAKAAGEAAGRDAAEKSARAGELSATSAAEADRLLAGMSAYVEHPRLEEAGTQIAGCQEDAARELEGIHGSLVELEAKMAARDQLAQEIGQQEARIGELERERESLREQMEQAGREQSGLQGQKEQLERKLDSQLQAHLGGCTLEDADDELQARRRETDDGLTLLDLRLQKAEEHLRRRATLEQQIPEQERSLRELEGGIARRREALAKLESQKEAAEEHIRGLRENLRYPDMEAARERCGALQRERTGLEAALEKAKEAYEARRRELAETDSAIRKLEELLRAAEPVDVGAEQARRAELTLRQRDLDRRKQELHTRLHTNGMILDNIREQEAGLARLDGEWAWMRALSGTVNGGLAGKGKVALETYVQMTCFDRILRRANTRLMVMSGGQYELLRRKADNQGQSGLELDVTDHYNGTRRSVRSLSGGEAFKASLSLALGLSDEIQSSAGGIRLDTMFVDEGFGSLDEESLQQAVQALAGLAEGQRLVGIISHVNELKERIDKQIVVTKSRSGGSSVEIVV